MSRHPVKERKKPSVSKKQRLKKTILPTIEENHLKVKDIRPLTYNQKHIFDSFKRDRHTFIHGYPGTGKTFLAIYLSFLDIMSNKSEYKKLVIVRSAVQSRDIGFLPGKTTDKMREFESPYIAMVNDLFGRGDAYHLLKNKETLDVISTSFLRGITINDSIILMDECQNLNFGELETVLTRSGKNCKIIFCGDVFQNDLMYKRHEMSGLVQFMRIIETMESFDFIQMTIDDVVRSGIIKEYLIAKEKVNGNS